MTQADEFAEWFESYATRTDSLCGVGPDLVSTIESYVRIGWVAAKAAPRRRMWSWVHNLVAHPLLVTRAAWATRLHDYTATRMET